VKLGRFNGKLFAVAVPVPVRALLEKSRKLQAEADEQALKLLSDEQRQGFEKMKGEKFELDRSELYGRPR
jgi:hypothetical protein